MLEELLNRLRGEPDTTQLSPESGRLALAAIMVRLARTDGRYTSSEMGQIDAVLAGRYGLGPDAVKALRADAEATEAVAPDTVSFTRVIKDAVPYEDRVGVIEALWRVAAADGVNADERGFLRLVASLIGVTDQDSGLARQRVVDQDGS